MQLALVVCLAGLCVAGVTKAQAVQEEAVEKRQDGSTDHFCCADPNIAKGRTEYRTKITYTRVLATHKEATGYVKCGALGATRCTTYTIRYSEDLQTHIESFPVTIYDPCPPNKIKCCEDYYETPDGHCVSYDLYADEKIRQNLLKLQQLGISIGK